MSNLPYKAASDQTVGRAKVTYPSPQSEGTTPRVSGEGSRTSLHERKLDVLVHSDRPAREKVMAIIDHFLPKPK